jgi:hypothetical protein
MPSGQIEHKIIIMPICTIQLISITVPLNAFVKDIRAINPQPVVLAKVVRWMITTTALSVDPLLKYDWDLLLIYEGTTGFAERLHAFTSRIFTIQAGVPSYITKSFATTNARLLHPDTLPPLTGSLDNPLMASSPQNLEYTSELSSWIASYDPNCTTGPVSMLNLLAFKPDMHSTYLKYGQAFASSIGSRRGGVAKIVGKVTGGDKGVTAAEGGWDEVALAHYPSIRHFADMAASKDYQAVNKEYRVPSLRDTCILCTSEVVLESEENHATKSKL